MNKFLFALSLLLGNSAVLAAPVTYNVSRTIGAGSVTGSIVTDGILGTLTQADILGWTLLLNDGSGSTTLFGPLTGNNSGVLLTGPGVTATSSSLSFNYGVTSQLLFQAPNIGSGVKFWCQEGPGANCTGSGVGEYVDVASTFPGQRAARTGIVAFASATPSAVVPEPETVALLSLGAVALAVSRRRKPAA